MSPTLRRLLLGIDEAPPPSIPAAAYVAGVLYLYLLGVVVGILRTGTPTLADPVAEPLLFPVAFVWTPPAVAALHAHRGGGLAGALGVGIGVGVTFLALGAFGELPWLQGRIDSSLWSRAVEFAATGGVVVGFLIGTGAYVLRNRLRRGTQPSS